MTRACFASLLAILALCATANADTPPAAPATQAAAPAAAPTEATGAKESRNAAAIAAQRDSLLKQARAQGYKTRQQGDKTVYCKSEAPLGSRFEKTQCVTEDVLFDMERSRQATKDQMLKATTTCGGSIGCSGG